MKETRLQEIKRCLARAEELGGSSTEPYDLEVRDVRYLVDMLEAAVNGILNGCESLAAKNTRAQIHEWLEEDLNYCKI